MKISIALLSFLLGITIGWSQSKDSAETTIDSILQGVEKLPSLEEKMDYLGKNFTQYRTSSHSKKLVDRALALAEKSNNSKVKASSHRYLGIYLFNHSQQDSALHVLKKASSYLKEGEAPVLKGSILAMMGGIYSRTGNIQQGIATMLDAQRVFDKIDTTKLEGEERFRHQNENLILSNSLANAYNQVEEYPTAILYYERAIQGYRSLGRMVEAGVTLMNKGDLYLKMEDYDIALQTLLEAHDLMLEGQAPDRFIAISNLNLGIAQLGLQNYREAEKRFDMAYATYDASKNMTGLTYVLTHRGELYNQIDAFETAKKDCETAFQFAAQNNNLEYQLKASECLFHALESLGEHQQALQVHKQYITFKDSIFNEKNVKKRTQLQMQYDFDQVQEAQQREAEKIEQQRKIYLYLSLIGLFVAGLVGFFLYKNNKKNRLLAKQKALLEATVDEKNVLLKETHHRVKNSFQIVSSLLYLQSENIEDKEAQLAMKEAQNRVRSMVLIHQKLYNKDQLVGINTEEYFSDLTRDIFECHQAEGNEIDYFLDVDSLVLDIETITPLGLILNELITNVIKHAFKPNSTEKKLHIHLTKENESLLLLKVIDTGTGMPETIEGNSFGIRLIKALSKKLRGKLEYQSNSPQGTIAQLTIHRFTEL